MKRSPKKNSGYKMYVVRKFVLARSALEAIKVESTHPVDAVFIDDDWASGKGKNLADALGFSTSTESDDVMV